MSPAIPLRILHTESSLNWGGQEYRTLEEVRWLRDRGHMAWIACDPDSELMKRAGGELCVPVRMKRSVDWRASHALRRFCREQRINVIHTHGSRDSWLCYPLHVAAWPVVRSRQITNEVRPSWDRSFIYRHGCTTIVASADCIRTSLIARTGVAAHRVQVIGEGTDVSRFAPSVDRRCVRKEWGIPDDVVLFGLVAMIRPEKGHRIFVEAVAELLKTHAGKGRFAIVGEGVGDRGYEREIRDLLVATFGAAAEPMFMTGYRQDMPEVMAALDVLVVPSLAEAQSIVTPQAFATGRPVIASCVGGLPELVTHEHTGLLVPPGDACALSSAMIRLIEDGTLRKAMGVRARLFAAHALSFNTKMQECVALYAKIAAVRRPIAARIAGKRAGTSIDGRRSTAPRRKGRGKRLAWIMTPLSAVAVMLLIFLKPAMDGVSPQPVAATAASKVRETESKNEALSGVVFGEDAEAEANVDESVSPNMFTTADERIIG